MNWIWFTLLIWFGYFVFFMFGRQWEKRRFRGVEDVFYAKAEELQTRLSIVLDYATGGRMTLSNYKIETMKHAIDANIERHCESIEQKYNELKAERDRLTAGKTECADCGSILARW